MSKCGTNHSTNQDVVCHGFNSLAYKIAVSLKLTVTSQAALESPAKVWLTPCSHCSQELFDVKRSNARVSQQSFQPGALNATDSQQLSRLLQ